MTLATYALVMRELKGLPALSAEAQVQAARQPRRPQVDLAVQLDLLRDEPRAQKGLQAREIGLFKDLRSTTVSTSAAAPSSRPRR
jgi:hypothetical protein